MLCETCTRMLRDLRDEKNEHVGRHHGDLKSFEVAAAAGCCICQPMMRYALKHAGSRHECLVDSFRYTQRYMAANKEQFFFFITLPICNGETFDIYRSFMITSTKGFALLKNSDTRDPTTGEPLGKAVHRIRRWMDDCLENHNCLRNPSTPAFYPSRLLDLGDTTFRVIRTATERPHDPYVALSYCWGSDPKFLRLTNLNEDDLQARAGNPLSELPTAFREAIEVVKRLNHRYLWIDSLCILQSGPGSADDWRVESTKMHEVYANSVFTLALANAASPEESVLGGGPIEHDCTPPFVFNDNTASTDCPWQIITSVDYFKEALYDQPLSKRAWALQERVMATRVVSFGSGGELFWDCAQLPNACEKIPGGLQCTQLVEPDDQDMFKLAKKSIPDAKEHEALVDVWFKLVDEYTRRSLTYPKVDKLVAISAIAKSIERSLDDVYIAGHFWKTLPLSLDWVVESAYSRGLRPQAKRMWSSQSAIGRDDRHCIPSWSWASMDGPIICYTDDGTMPSREYASLADAESYVIVSNDGSDSSVPQRIPTVSIRGHCCAIQWQEGRPVLLARSEEWDKNYYLTVDLDEPDFVWPDGTNHVIVALAALASNQIWSGLMLEKATQDGEAVYRRIGHFKLRSKQSLNLWSERDLLFGVEKVLIKLM